MELQDKMSVFCSENFCSMAVGKRRSCGRPVRSTLPVALEVTKRVTLTTERK